MCYLVEIILAAIEYNCYLSQSSLLRHAMCLEVDVLILFRNGLSIYRSSYLVICLTVMPLAEQDVIVLFC